MEEKYNNLKIKQKDIINIDMCSTFFHYTNKDNLSSIIQNGLEPRIGPNSMYVEKSKKVFFAVGVKGILTIMDVWLRWLTSKTPINNLIYKLGIFYMRTPICIKGIPNYVVKKILNKKSNRIKAYNKMQKILDDSIFLILDLEENIDFSYNDIDEVKDTYYESFLKNLYSSESNVNDTKMEYWNMHTFSNVKIEPNKISLLKYNNYYSCSDIIKCLIEENMEYVKEKCNFLYEYYNYIY